MTYKIAYLEDQKAQSVIEDLKPFELLVEHFQPRDFEETIKDIDTYQPDLILMDFRLTEAGGFVEAPSYAQYFRSHAIDKKLQPVPIVLLSNDTVIHEFYEKDYTSHDLFDYLIYKDSLNPNLKKYASLIKELIGAYQKINEIQQDPSLSLESLIQVPEPIKHRIDPRVYEALENKQNSTDVYSASAFVLNTIVKPIGILIGEDVLSARLGISKKSKDWKCLKELIKDYIYSGVFSGTYDRWWSSGIELWWKNEFPDQLPIGRLNSQERYGEIVKKTGLDDLDMIEQENPTRLWTICKSTYSQLDLKNGFEISREINKYPWIDREYFSFDVLLESSGKEISELKESEKARFKAKRVAG